MDPVTLKSTRRLILTTLYDQYLADPLRMLTPSEMLETEELTRENLAANAHYLHERGLIELLTGYNAPLFAATRISPEGIDLVEDTARFREVMGHDAAVVDDISADAPRLVLKVAEEANVSNLSDVRKQWLLDDLRSLRDEFRKAPHERQEHVVRGLLAAVSDYFDGDSGEALPSFRELRVYLGAGE